MRRPPPEGQSQQAEPSYLRWRSRHTLLKPASPHPGSCPRTPCRWSPQQAENRKPIAHRLRPAGSGFQDFRTPAGIRNSSGERSGRFRALRWRRRTLVQKAGQGGRRAGFWLNPASPLWDGDREKWMFVHPLGQGGGECPPVVDNGSPLSAGARRDRISVQRQGRWFDLLRVTNGRPTAPGRRS